MAGATGASGVAGVDVTHRHRRPQAANRPCGARIRRENREEGAKGGTGEIVAAPPDGNDTVKFSSLNLTESDERSAHHLLDGMNLA